MYELNYEDDEFGEKEYKYGSGDGSIDYGTGYGQPISITRTIFTNRYQSVDIIE